VSTRDSVGPVHDWQRSLRLRPRLAPSKRPAMATSGSSLRGKHRISTRPPRFTRGLKTGHCRWTAAGFASPENPNPTLDTLGSPKG
jgi:hypothetical protein